MKDPVPHHELAAYTSKSNATKAQFHSVLFSCHSVASSVASKSLSPFSRLVHYQAMRRSNSTEMRQHTQSTFSFTMEDGGGCSCPPEVKVRQRHHTGDATSGSSFFSWSWFSLPGVRGSPRHAQSQGSDNEVEGNDIYPLITKTKNLDYEYTSQSSDSADSFDSVSFDLENQRPQTFPDKVKRPTRPLGKLRESIKEKSKPLDVNEYAACREMTKTQELWNAVSMVPPTVYCFVYMCTTAWWINADLLAKAEEDYVSDPQNFIAQVSGQTTENATWGNFRAAQFSPGCLHSDVLPALPPLTVLAVIAGTALHMPCSFLYHWKYSHTLDRIARLNHWSRRLDHAMIHLCSALYAYGSSGSLDFFLASALFNLHCMYRHFFLPHSRPRSNQLRVAIAIIAYSLPILRRGDVWIFVLFWAIVGFGLWLFSQYPIGGWSHCAFHLVIGCVPVLLLEVAKALPVAQPELMLAAQCSVLNQHS